MKNKILFCLLVIAIVLTTALSFTACNKDGDQGGALKGVHFEDGRLSWDSDSIVGAAVDKYKVFVNKVESRIDLTDNGKKLSVNLAEKVNAETQDIEVTVQAKGDTITIDETFHVIRLQPLSLTVKNGYVDWTDSVRDNDYASKVGEEAVMVYDLLIDGKSGAYTNETSYKLTTGVTHVVKVRPRIVQNGNSFYYTSYSDEVSATILSEPQVTQVNWHIERNPQGEILDGAYAVIEWSTPAVNQGISYKGSINGVEFVTDVARLDTSDKNLFKDVKIDVKEGFELSLQAISSNTAIDPSAITPVRKYIALDKVRSANIVDGVLSFGAVKNAIAYVVRVNGSENTITDTFMKLNTQNSSVTINIRPVAAEGVIATTSWSDDLSFSQLNSPEFYYDSKAFVINPGSGIENVRGYAIRIKKEVESDGKTVIEDVGIFEQATLNKLFSLNQYAFEEEGRYWVDVKSLAALDSGNLDSAYCEPYEVIRLGIVPSISVKTTQGVKKAEGGLEITVEKINKFSNEPGVRYQLLMGGTEISASQGGVFKVPKPRSFDENTYEFTVRVISDNAVDKKKVVLSSTKEVTFNVVKLAAPRSLRLVDDTDEEGNNYVPSAYVTWEMPDPYEAILKGNGTGQYSDILYDYQVKMSGLHTVKADTGNKFFLKGDLSAGSTINVSVYARSKMDLNPGMDSVKLTCGLDANNQPVVTKINNENAKVDSGAPVIVLSSDYSNTETFVKLESPRDLTMQDRTLSWTGVRGASGYDVLVVMAPEKDAGADAENIYGRIAHVLSPNFSIDDMKGKTINGQNVYSLLSTGGALIDVVAVGNRGNFENNGSASNNYESSNYYSFDSSISSNTSTLLFKLDAPTGLKVDDTNLYWTPVSFATGYRVFQDGKWIANVTNAAIPISQFDRSQGAMSITVVAVGDSGRLEGERKFFASEESEAFLFYKLHDLKVTRVDNIYCWPAEKYAINYQLEIGGVNTSIATDWSAKTSDKVRDDDKHWFKLTDSESKVVKDDNGEPIIYYFYKPVFTQPSDGVSIKVRASANNGQPSDVIKNNTGYEAPVIASDWTEFRQKVVRVARPVFYNGATFTLDTLYPTFSVEANIPDAPANCSYKFNIGTTEFYSESKKFVYSSAQGDMVEKGKYEVQVAYGANFFDEQGVYNLDSEYANGQFSFVFLKRPYDINVGDGKVEWSAIDGASSYRYQYLIYASEKDDDTATFTVKELLYTSEVGYVEHGFSSFKYSVRNALGNDYDENAYYAVVVRVMSVGNQVDSVTSFEVFDNADHPATSIK